MPSYLPRRRLPIASVAALLSCAGAAEAATYRCTDGKGRVTFQDFPCDGAKPATPAAGPPNSGNRPTPTVPGTSPSAPAGDLGYSSFIGAWRGPGQMHFTSGGQRDLTAHRVTPIVIEVQADGKVQGVMSEVGCKLSGLGGQFVTPTIASIDVTATGCADRRFDGRYSGTLSVNRSTREGGLQIRQLITPLRKVEIATVEAVLKR